MAKILIGILAAIIIAVAGFFGFQFYLQQQAAAQVEASIERIRGVGGKASHGEVTFDLLKRTVTIADIEVEPATQSSVTFRIGRLMASGVGHDATRFTADQIDFADFEIAGGKVDLAPWHVSYKAPRVTVKDFSEPVGLPPPPASSSPIDFYRFALERFAGISAASVSIQSIVGSLELSGAAPVAGDFSYSDIAMDGIKDGKIATTKVASAVYTLNTQQAGRPDKVTGNLTNVVSSDVDITAIAAILDPQKANDDRTYRAYRQISAGAYAITSAQGVHAQIDGIKVEDVGLRPSRLQISALLAMMPAVGTTPTPAQARTMMETVAGVYEGIHIGNAEIRGLAIDAPQGPVKLSAIRFNLENGRGDFAIEGLDVHAPTGAIRVERFALKSLDLANWLRTVALFPNPGQKPAPDQALKFLSVLEAVEVRGLVAPYKNTGKQISMDVSLNWGQFVGPIPTKAHLTARMSVPVDPTDLAQRQLIALGLDPVTIDADLGLAWTEASRAFVLDPVKIEIGGLADVSAHAALANVPRTAFSLDPQQASVMAAQIEVGTLEVTLRDLGGVGLLVAQRARTQGASADDARRAIVEAIKASTAPKTATSADAASPDAANPVAAHPDAVAITDALARFVEDPKGTLTIKLAPRAITPALQLIQLVPTQPLDALAQFNVEVSTGP